MELLSLDAWRALFAAPLTPAGPAVRVTVLQVLATGGLLWLALWLSHEFERIVAAPALRRLRVEQARGFTVARMAHYLLAVVVFLLGAQLVHLDLGAIGWLVGLLSIGIGFGLQNVTSNFVSGLIVVLERPIKPGDFVTVGEFAGVVREIRLRSTTIVTMDNVKIIVPNSEFISKHVINRSFRDERVRLHVPVRLTHGSDPDVVREALLEAAVAHPRILKAPEPTVWLVEFGADALHFELLAWIDEPEDGPPIRSELNYAIYRACTARGLTMPHAQHDLHVKGPVAVRLEPLPAKERLPGVS
ncbi:MAG: mechanosensitive ion channel domain-containing protein [Candidatus Sericytochromatia bacterium]|nr:mechanosensitive ion channel domain-containing protein [Candidatus Sericytochromatia bacterium]